jgi:hypothetical protein
MNTGVIDPPMPVVKEPVIKPAPIESGFTDAIEPGWLKVLDCVEKLGGIWI